MSEDALQRVWILRKLLHNMDDDIAAVGVFTGISSKTRKPMMSFSWQ